MVWDEKEKVSRRAMHEAIFEAGWKHEKMRSQHRRVISPIHQGKGREIIALDWTFSYHPYSEKIFAAKEAYDYVNRSWSCYQTVVTASISNGQQVDGIAVEVQHPNYQKEELAYARDDSQRKLRADGASQRTLGRVTALSKKSTCEPAKERK